MNREDLAPRQAERGISDHLSTCHTALIDFDRSGAMQVFASH